MCVGWHCYKQNDHQLIILCYFLYGEDGQVCKLPIRCKKWCKLPIRCEKMMQVNQLNVKNKVNQKPYFKNTKVLFYCTEGYAFSELMALENNPGRRSEMGYCHLRSVTLNFDFQHDTHMTNTNLAEPITSF